MHNSRNIVTQSSDNRVVLIKIIAEVKCYLADLSQARDTESPLDSVTRRFLGADGLSASAQHQRQHHKQA